MLTTIILFIVILGIIVFVHELGHFYAARKMGMGVEEFGFGFPPRIIGVQKKDSSKKGISNWKIIKGSKGNDGLTKSNTVYSLNWIPIGGFVKIKGEQGDKKGENDSFSNKKIWQRAIVLSAGVFMNFVLAVVIISIGFMLGLPSILDSELPANADIKDKKIQILEVKEGSPAENNNLKMGDFILSYDGETISSIDDFQRLTREKLNKEISLIVIRGNEEIEIKVVPEDLEGEGEGAIGVWLVESGLVSYPWHFSIWMGAKTTVLVTWEIIKAIFDMLKGLITSQESRIGEVAGPVGIAALTGQVAQLGYIYVLQFIALLSINLGILNFIPFPALDGGRVLFLIIEKIKGSPINQKIENIIHTTGFFILISLVLVVTIKDISRFSESIKNFLSNIF